MTAPAVTHAERELVEFIDRVTDRYRKSSGRAFIARNQFIPTPVETKRRNYDQDTTTIENYLRRSA